jgi:GDP-mannose 6-dehydrogenase
LRALIHTARRNDVEMPVLSNVLVSNEAHLRRAVDTVIGLGHRKIGVFGLSFKAGTDDLRESPMVELVERLFGKGCDIRVFDPTVSLSRLMGANRAFIDDRLPHVGDMLSDDADAVLAHADVLVVGSRDDRVVEAIGNARPEHIVVDLVRLPDAEARRGSAGYIGIGW